MKVGFIGLGNLGRPMAANILRGGHSLTVHDVNPEAATSLLEEGAAWGESPKAVAEASEVIITSLPSPKEIEAVALGEEGVIHGIAPDAVYIDLSTSSPILIRRIHGIFKEKGYHVMDAPIFGAPPMAWERKVMLMASGEEEIYHRCYPVLNAIGETVRYCGAIGSGSVCKLMLNYMSASGYMVMMEGFTLGLKAGLDPRILWETTQASNLFGTTPLERFPRTLLKGNFEPGFFLSLAYKDLGLALELGKDVAVPLNHGALTFQELREAMNRPGWAQQDSSIAMQLQEERAGVQFRLPGL